MKKIFLSLVIIFFLQMGEVLLSQNIGINATGSSADASAMLDVSWQPTKECCFHVWQCKALLTEQQFQILLPAFWCILKAEC